MTPSIENAFPAPSAVRVPHAPSDPSPSGEAPPAPPDAEAAEREAEAAAWAGVVAAWNDEARHRAYLARFDDLAGLAVAGGRYRAALAARPRDPVAARFRDEVLRRAVAHGLASLPRTEPELPRAKLAVRVAAGAVVAGLVLAAALMASRLLPFVSSGARP